MTRICATEILRRLLAYTAAPKKDYDGKSSNACSDEDSESSDSTSKCGNLILSG